VCTRQLKYFFFNRLLDLADASLLAKNSRLTMSATFPTVTLIAWSLADVIVNTVTSFKYGTALKSNTSSLEVDCDVTSTSVDLWALSVGHDDVDDMPGVGRNATIYEKHCCVLRQHYDVALDMDVRWRQAFTVFGGRGSNI
jgi:hypothetical protein